MGPKEVEEEMDEHAQGLEEAEEADQLRRKRVPKRRQEEEAKEEEMPEVTKKEEEKLEMMVDKEGPTNSPYW
jgi:hypothetical protein